jgi:hypothetical protein
MEEKKNEKNKLNNEIRKLKDLMKEKDETINRLNLKCENYEKQNSELKEMKEVKRSLNITKESNKFLIEEKSKIENNYNILVNDNKQLKTKYNNIAKELEKIKRSYNSLNETFEQKNKNEDKKYRELINSNNDLKNNIELKDKEILKLKAAIEEHNQENLNKKNRFGRFSKNKYAKDNLDIEKDDKVDKNNLFNTLYKKYILKNLIQNKIKMIIGVYLQKQKIDFNKRSKSLEDQNNKLKNQVKKLNDKIIEFNLTNLNINTENIKLYDNDNKETITCSSDNL